MRSLAQNTEIISLPHHRSKYAFSEGTYMGHRHCDYLRFQPDAWTCARLRLIFSNIKSAFSFSFNCNFVNSSITILSLAILFHEIFIKHTRVLQFVFNAIFGETVSNWTAVKINISMWVFLCFLFKFLHSHVL